MSASLCNHETDWISIFHQAKSHFITNYKLCRRILILCYIFQVTSTPNPEIALARYIIKIASKYYMMILTIACEAVPAFW